MHTTNDIVISAYGMLSALGLGCEESVAAWNEGESACFPAARTTPPETCDPLAGEVPDFALTDFLPTPKAYLDRQSELMLAAAAMARTAGRLKPTSFAAERSGLSMGSAWGALQTLDLFFDDYVKKGPRLVKPLLFPHSYANAAISLVAMEWECCGPHLNFVSANDASSQALIAALDMLRNDEADLVMAGGAEGLNAVRWRARVAQHNCTPPGEGAAVLLIEHEATARARGLVPLAYLRGGASCNGAAQDLPQTCAAAMQQALEDANMVAADIRTLYANASAQTCMAGPTHWTVQVPADLYGDVEGASGALQTACALLSAPDSLPALILTCTLSGTASALVVDRP